ncbi:MAG: hypothetical protein K9M08_24075 [Pirellula sp.]|nr:hypothetical protein [Pirellula sp.]
MSNSLVTRSGYTFKFNEDNIDSFSHEFTSLITPSEAKAETFLLSLYGGYDDKSFFVNDLRVYLSFNDPSSGNLIIEDISRQIAAHYIAAILKQYPSVDHFVGNNPYPPSSCMRKMVRLVAYHEGDVDAAAREARAKEILAGIYTRMLASDGDKLGLGNRSGELDKLHWFSMVHADIPVLPLDLSKLVNSEGQGLLPNAASLDDPLGLTFSAGRIDMTRDQRNDSVVIGDDVVKYTRGSVTFDFSIIFKNPLADDIKDILSRLTVSEKRIKGIIDKIRDMDSNLSESLSNFNLVKAATEGIELRLTTVQSDLVENKNVLTAISDQVEKL